MFKFLKEKLKSAISRISKEVSEEGPIEEKPLEEVIKKGETGFFVKLKEKFSGKEAKAKEAELAAEKEEPAVEEKRKEPKLKKEEKPAATGHKKPAAAEHKKPEHPTKIKEEIRHLKEPELPTKQKAEEAAEPEAEPEKKGFFGAIKEKILTTKINGEQFEKLFRDLELALMENNVAVEVIERIKKDLKGQLVEKPIKRAQVEATIHEALKDSIKGLFEEGNFNLIDEIGAKKEKPYVIAFFGINGSGKTTSIAKLASMLKAKGVSCVLAASDTFRAASIEQLQHHADKIGIKVIKHTYGSDPAAVAFDAIKHAKAKGIDAVLIDTAGRMHSNVNLIDEMKKIIRVAKPDLRIFVGESITGNDCIEQAKAFNEAVGIDGIILAKADVDEKGGAAVSVSYVTKKPIMYLGVGQMYDDLREFEPRIVVEGLGL